MLSHLNQSGTRALILNILVAVVAVTGINVLIFTFNWDISAESTVKSLFAPPEYLIGIVWTILFILMAIARWWLNSYGATGKSARTWITVLMISCLVYPLYSLALGSRIGGLLGNLETITLTIFVVVRVWSISKSAALLVLPVIPWVIYATATILIQ